MRATFTRVMERTLEDDPQSALLLGDIGVFGFRESLRRFPDRVFNIGILEQATVGVAAGLAKAGLKPVVHTIAPFLVERALEQIKVDLAYNELSARLVSVGASFDYAALGGTHHCPGDVMALTAVPGVGIVVPGTSSEFEALFSEPQSTLSTTYFRLSEKENEYSKKVKFGTPLLMKSGLGPTIISVGTTGEIVAKATEGFDVSHIYLTTLRPLNVESVRHLLVGPRVLIVEPFYEGSTLTLLNAALGGGFIHARSIGLSHDFLRNYGTAEEHWRALGLTAERIREEVLQA